MQASMCSERNMLVHYGKVLEPQSFHSTTEARISLFELEVKLIEQGISRLLQQKDELLELQEPIQRLIDATKQSVEINDDDHRKAILVSTIVTWSSFP
jgi:hypothetical protein